MRKALLAAAIAGLVIVLYAAAGYWLAPRFVREALVEQANRLGLEHAGRGPQRKRRPRVGLAMASGLDRPAACRAPAERCARGRPQGRAELAVSRGGGPGTTKPNPCRRAAARSVRRRGASGGPLEGPLEAWKKLRARIHEDICRNGYDEKKQAFVQSYGSQELDASLLLIPITGFLPADDPRMLGTVKAIERELMHGGLVHRYRTEHADDGLPPGEGAFVACSFWLADNYVLQGRTREARELFERLLALANDVGLLAEEYDPREKRQLGNFPQAFSHVALVNTAFNLGERTKPAEERGA